VKRPALHYIFPVLLALATAFVFNNCQGGLFGSKGFTSAKSKCVAGLYKGQLSKLSDGVEPSPFAAQKVRLSSSSGTAVQSKVEAPVTVKAGEKLTVTLDNACVMNPDSVKGAITTEAIKSAATYAELERQVYLWTLPRDYSSDEIEQLTADEPCIAGVSWNRTYKMQAYNDTGALYQSYLGSINGENAYPLFYNDSGGMTRTGNPVIIAVIDTGVDWQHPDLQANIWTHAYGAGIDITTLGTNVSYNPMDVSGIGHGTHVAGSIAAVTDNTVGISGTMPFRAKIMAIKLFAVDQAGELTTTSQHLANALRFAHQNGAHVINLSIGNITNSPNSDATVEAGVNEAVAAGVTVVTVTGNADGGQSGREINGQTLTVIPGMYATRQGVIGVGSYETSTGNKSYFSHYSTTYGEIAAPGAEQGINGIYSTLPTSLNSYGRLAGTSQAAPLVSAAAGLVVGIIRDAYNVIPKPADVERLILASAAKDSRLTPYFKEGNRLDLLRLVQRINAEYPQTRSSSSGSMDLSSLACPQ